MDDATRQEQESGQLLPVYYPDRRSALQAIALVGGGLALELFFPSTAEAKARGKYYPIVFRLNGGKNPVKQKARIKGGKQLAASKLKKPSKRGYKFVAWYSNKALTKRTQYVYGKARKSKRTVYAKWKPKVYTISYDLNGGKAQKKLPTRYTIESKRIVPYPPKRTGREFIGWYTSDAFTTPRPTIEPGSVGNVKLHARWKLIRYSIAYELYGGTPTIVLPASYTIKSDDIEPFHPTRDGYRFVNWCSDPGCTVTKSSIDTGSTGNITLYAKWTPVDYWNAHLEQKCKRVNDLVREKGIDTPSFVFVTDMHLPSNALVSPYLIRQVARKTNTNMVIFGGDAINSATVKSDALGMLSYIRNAFPGMEVHLVRGNHDANGEGSTKGDYPRISLSEFASIAAEGHEARENGKAHCYRDDKTRKIRYIFLDTGAPNSDYIREEQLVWLSNRVCELEAGWTVLVFAHQFFQGGSNSKPDYDKNGKLIKARLDSIFDKAKADIAGVLSGHCHRNIYAYSYAGSEKLYPMISTECDAGPKVSSSRLSERKSGTICEQAFDIVTLDTKNHKLYLTRVGAGEDREFEYKSKQQPDEPPDDPSTNPNANLQAARL